MKATEQYHGAVRFNSFNFTGASMTLVLATSKGVVTAAEMPPAKEKVKILKNPPCYISSFF